MKRYIAVIELDDDEEIVGDANISYTYCSNGTNYTSSLLFVILTYFV